MQFIYGLLLQLLNQNYVLGYMTRWCNIVCDYVLGYMTRWCIIVCDYCIKATLFTTVHVTVLYDCELCFMTVNCVTLLLCVL